MSRERTESGGFDLLPPGDYLFTVDKPVEKRRSDKGHIFYLWKLKTATDEGVKPFTHMAMAWKVGPLLEALGYQGFKEKSKVVYDWDREEVQGKQFIASCRHEPDFNDPKVIRARLYNFRSLEEASQPPPAEIETSETEEAIGFD